MQKKVLLVGDSPISMSPYISSYIELFEKHNIPYELIFWNKTMENVNQFPKEYVPYNYAHDNTMPAWKKIFKIYSFAKYTKKHIRAKDYSYIVVFTIAHAVFFHPFLERKYKGRYIFDIRDHSPLCNISFIKGIIKKLVNNSAFTVLSSRGFLRWLPYVDKSKIIISHNITISALEKGLNFCPQFQEVEKQREEDTRIVLLTIGQLRDFSANKIIIEALSNKKEFELVFSGDGPSKKSLERISNESGFRNVKFTGRYSKCDEEKIVRHCDIINNFTNRDINSDSLISNRFYLATTLRKPMIVRDGTYQAEIAKKFGLACVIGEKVNFGDEICGFMKNLDIDRYNFLCKSFLAVVLEDMREFENKLITLFV